MYGYLPPLSHRPVSILRCRTPHLNRGTCDLCFLVSPYILFCYKCVLKAYIIFSVCVFLTQSRQGFFRRSLLKKDEYKCLKDRSRCPVKAGKRARGSCGYCRYQKCLKVGMSFEGEPPYQHTVSLCKFYFYTRISR